MKDPDPSEADRLARHVLTSRLQLRRGENVTIETFPTALPWAIGFVREARRLGARPLLHYEDEDSYWTAIDEGGADTLGTPGSHEWAALAETDVYIYFWGPEDHARLSQLPAPSLEKATEFNPKWYRVAGRSRVRGARIGIARVTESNARFWGVPLEAWRQETVQAIMLDPRQMIPDARKVVKALEHGHHVHVHHPNGTDLSFTLTGRKAEALLGWCKGVSRQGRLDSMVTVPQGCVYVAVDEPTAVGTLVANRMSSLWRNPVRNGRWTFRNGRLVGQSYASGASVVRAAYSAGGKGRDRLSFLRVGLDPSVSISPMLEGNARGALSIGAGGNTGLGGTNQSSFVAHLTVAGAELTVDGRAIVRDGHIV